MRGRRQRARLADRVSIIRMQAEHTVLLVNRVASTRDQETVDVLAVRREATQVSIVWLMGA